jgi:hypothetical protein
MINIIMTPVNEGIDFLLRRLAIRGGVGESPRRFAPLGVSRPSTTINHAIKFNTVL